MLIGASLLLPVLNRMRGDARQAACANNLAVAGTAIGRYGADHGLMLCPEERYAPARFGGTWGSRIDPRGWSNPIRHTCTSWYGSITYTPILFSVRTTLGRPTRLDDTMFDWPNAKAVSYSYQNQYTPKANPDRSSVGDGHSWPTKTPCL